ncbi:TRAP transporter large permease subunit [Terasakiella sp. SH-1]|uniref:TRAP transporter large permease n=1 Tax=Terasakiella sp. SH-1 TaxID=2560057 RepID=UPI001073425B|nr:TRAP transporter large permease subunit [Terasakiella sp. SH-1]
MIEHFEEFLAAYMFLTLGITLFAGLPVAFTLGGVALGFGLLGWEFGYLQPNEFFLFVERLWQGAAQNLVLVAIPCFIFMGTMLERSLVAKDLLYILQVLMRRVPGGLALSVTVMGTIMAATTGIIGASVVMMTMMALPTMLYQRYHTPLATGTIAASATLGILIPPSIMLVIMADLMAISVGNLFLGAIVPGLILSCLYFVYILFIASKNPHWAPPLSDDIGPESTKELVILLLKGFVPPVFLIIMVLGSIFGGWATPTEAGGVGAFGAILLALFNGRLNKEALQDVCHRTALTAGMIFMIFLGATAFSYIFRALYGEDLIIEFINYLDLGSWGLLFLLMAVIFLLGFFFDWIEITLIILPVFTPIVAAMDLGGYVEQKDILYWFAILAAINLQTSFLTPPFGFALFYMKGVAPSSVKMKQIYAGIIPFILLQLFGLALVILWPQLALWLPNELLQ